jgi:hypothetical protein
MPVSFGTENDAPSSLPNNTINKGRWMPEEHKIFMEEYEKYGNNSTLIANVLSTQTPAQIKKHSECIFKQNVRTNSAAVKQYQESLSSKKKAQVLVTHATENKTIDNLSLNTNLINNIESLKVLIIVKILELDKQTINQIRFFKNPIQTSINDAITNPSN